MAVFVARRVFEGAFSLWAVLTLVFVLMQIVPGDPAEAALVQSTASQEQLERQRAALGLDQPIVRQYVRALLGVVSEQSPVSWSTGGSVRTAVSEHFGATAALAVTSMGIAIVLGFALGVVGAIGRGPIDAAGRTIAGILVAVPIMFSGTFLIWIFAITLDWLPATGQQGLNSLILPAIAVGLSASGAIARAVDAALADVMNMPFILAARARGLRQSKIVWRHALPVALLPILDVLSVQFGYLIAGTIIAETVFARQGLGRLLLAAVVNKDLPVVQGVITINAFFYIAFNLLSDVLRGLIDPRIRFG